jgi:hypothetical protein
MRFDVYGRMQLIVDRVDDGYRVYEVGAEGKRRLLHDLHVPAEFDEEGILRYLDDVFHELGRPGRTIRRIA